MLLPALAVAFVLQSRGEIPIVSGLGVSGVTQGGRAPVGIDTVQSLVVEGKWAEPHAGDKVSGARGGDRTWAEVMANKDGVFEGGPTAGGYVFATVDSDVDKPMLLQASGDTMVYINGVPRAGDPYSYGYLKIPFPMKKGHNTFLFNCGRGRLQAKLIDVGKPEAVLINTDDLTLPDILVDRDEKLLGAVPIINCTARRLVGLYMVIESGPEALGAVELPPIQPFSIRKVPFQFHYGGKASTGEIPIELSIEEQTRDTMVIHDHAGVKVRVRKPTEHYKRTFVSKIDGSVQYYAVCPALKPSKDNALIMTVHGASVEAIGQAAAYQPKDWCTIVAPTNRRPYGFDWEDWGRMDGMEVWDIAKKEFPHDPRRVILTGHSMGGHGTWTLGLTYPNEFAAIGPSAGWISFWSYAGGWEPRDPNPVEQLLRRSMNSSDTLLMLNNINRHNLFILHGDKDDNVPVEQAREMKRRLEEAGYKFDGPHDMSGMPVAWRAYHEQPGAGHWWGNECVDWPPMFDMFRDSKKMTASTAFSFTTVNPGVSSTLESCTIDQQINPLMPSKLTHKEHVGSSDIETENVAAFTISTNTTSQIDGQIVTMKTLPTNGARTGTGTFVKVGNKWTAVDALPAGEKTPLKSGPFKLAFQNRMVFVVGTKGTAEENEWSVNKARYDAESWYYRGNGAVDIIKDTEVGRYKDRNLIVYGNADTNKAFSLIPKAPVLIKRGSILVGDQELRGQDLAAVFLYPQGKRLIAVVGGTGQAGMLFTDRLPYFTSGVAYPDWAVFRTSALTQGSKKVLGAGFFDNRWKFDRGQSAFVGE